MLLPDHKGLWSAVCSMTETCGSGKGDHVQEASRAICSVPAGRKLQVKFLAILPNRENRALPMNHFEV